MSSRVLQILFDKLIGARYPLLWRSWQRVGLIIPRSRVRPSPGAVFAKKTETKRERKHRPEYQQKSKAHIFTAQQNSRKQGELFRFLGASLSKPFYVEGGGGLNFFPCVVDEARKPRVYKKANHKSPLLAPVW